MSTLTQVAESPPDDAPAPDLADLSLEAWRATVLRGETVLGHREWAERQALLMGAPEEAP